MSCVLRVHGTEFDVDAFLAEYPIETNSIYRKGEPKHPRSKPDGPKLIRSGMNIDVSNAEFNEYPCQIEDAIAYLSNETNARIIERLVSYPGVDLAGLDFGVEFTDQSCAPSVVFPLELIKLSGKLGLYIEASIY
jgi:hypothetical protein